MYPSVKEKSALKRRQRKIKGQFLRVSVRARVYSMCVAECVVLYAYFSLCVCVCVCVVKRGRPDGVNMLVVRCTLDVGLRS